MHTENKIRLFSFSIHMQGEGRWPHCTYISGQGVNPISLVVSISTTSSWERMFSQALFIQSQGSWGGVTAK